MDAQIFNLGAVTLIPSPKCVVFVEIFPHAVCVYELCVAIAINLSGWQDCLAWPHGRISGALRFGMQMANDTY